MNRFSNQRKRSIYDRKSLKTVPKIVRESMCYLRQMLEWNETPKSHTCVRQIFAFYVARKIYTSPPPPSLLLLSLSTPKPPTHLVGEWFGAKMSEKDWLPRHAFSLSLSHTFTLSLYLIQ
jgi:hypothetical protein